MVHMLAHFDLHVRCWFDKAEGSMVGMGVHQPERDWDVVVLTLVRNRDGAIDVDQIPLDPVIEDELVLLRNQTPVMVKKRENVPFCEIRISILHLGESSAQQRLDILVRHFCRYQERG